MKPKLIFCLILLLSVYNGNSQNLMHGLGANISIIYGNVSTRYSSSSFLMQVTHFSYFPRYTLTEAENSSLSVGSPMGVGINLITETTGDAGVAWGFDLPLVLDYNIGCMSTPENENSFGGYFGAGFGYMYCSYKLSADEGTIKTYGPMGRAGIRFASGEGKWHTTVGMYYKMSLEKQKFNTVGFNVYMDL
jgi:hypothetical protein